MSVPVFDAKQSVKSSNFYVLLYDHFKLESCPFRMCWITLGLVKLFGLS